MSNLENIENIVVELKKNQQLQQQHIRKQKRQIASLRERLARMEKLWELTISDPDLKWLYQNRSERMDPTVEIFDAGRAKFHLDRYRFAAERVAGSVVADIACGTGYGCRVLSADGKAAVVTGVDIDLPSIEYAKRQHAVSGVEFVCADGISTGLADTSVDTIVSFETLEHVPDETSLLAEFCRLLKPAGTLICSTPNNWPLDIAPHHVRVYDRDSFKKSLQPYFKIIELFSQNSGTDFEYNHQQASGIEPTTDDNHLLAECFIAVAIKK